jgi:transposase
MSDALQSGFPEELWTVKRVRALVARQFGVEYSNTGCWELLRPGVLAAKAGEARHPAK